MPSHNCLFIIGAPRTGSTILYQLITNIFDVLYIDNLTNLARYNPYFGIWLSNLFFQNKSHDSFTSTYGNTSADGLKAPCEGLFLYKYFTRDRHYVEPHEIKDRDKKRFRQTLIAIINKYQKPLVIKNLSFSQRLSALSEIIPEAKYVVVRRNPIYTSQSLLLARRKNRVPDSEIWGILPKDYLHLKGLDPFNLVVRQIYMIEKQIYIDSKKVPPEKIIWLNYEDFESNLEDKLNHIKEFIGSELETRPGGTFPAIKIQNRQTLEDTEFQRLKKIIDFFDWKEYKTDSNNVI